MSTNPCIITGCDLYDVEHNRWAHGDLFEYGDCYVFNAVVQKDNEVVWRQQQWGDKFLTLLNVQSYPGYFERRGIFVIPKHLAHLNQAARDYIRS